MLKKRIASLLLAGTMLFGLAACAGGTAPTSGAPSAGTPAATEGEEPAAAEEPTPADAVPAEEASGTPEEVVVELSMLSLPANVSGVQTGWWALELEKAVGIRLNMLPSGDQGEQKLQALMASGELPDMVIFKDNKQAENAVDGDMLLSYDDYQEMLPNLYANAPEALAFAREKLSMGKGKAYVVGSKIKNSPETRGNQGPYLRYDLYKEIGSPPITNGPDLLNALIEMQKLEPETEGGQKVYAVSAFKDWDRSYMTLGMFYSSMFGSGIPGESTLAQVHYDDPENPTFTTILDEGTKYMEWVRFLYDANQVGLLDPGSMSQRFEDSVQKVGDGRVLMVLDGWGAADYNTYERQQAGKGILPVITSGYKRSMGGINLTGSNWTVGIGKNTEYAEKALQFIDWMYSYEGSRITLNGPKGVIWDEDENGQPYLLEKKYEVDQNTEAEFADGKSFIQGSCQMGLTQALWLSSIDPANGATVSANYWPEPDYAPEPTAIWETWRADYGALDPVDYLMKDQSRYFLNPMTINPILTDEMEQISARVGDIIKTESWKMAYAADDGEYEAIKDQMIADAKEVGIDRFVEWYSAEYMTLWNEAVGR